MLVMDVWEVAGFWGRDVQMPPMMKGRQNHVLDLTIFQLCAIVVRPKRAAKLMAAGRLGT